MQTATSQPEDLTQYLDSLPTKEVIINRIEQIDEEKKRLTRLLRIANKSQPSSTGSIPVAQRG